MKSMPNLLLSVLLALILLVVAPPSHAQEDVILSDLMTDYAGPMEYTLGLGWDSACVFEEVNALLHVSRIPGTWNFVYHSVAWNTESGALPASIDTGATSEYHFSAALLPPAGYRFSDDLEVPELQLTVKVLEHVEKIPLAWPASDDFFHTDGENHALGTDPKEILESLTSRGLYLQDASGNFIFPNIDWDLSGIHVHTPGWYTAKGYCTLSDANNQSLRYSLPQNAQPLSIPIYIRDNSKFEILLNSAYSTDFYGQSYLPDGTAAPKEGIVLYYAYFGEEKPDKETLDQTSFTQDDAFFYEKDEGEFSIEFDEMPQEDGWYAFYQQAGELTSNYILLHSKLLSSSVDYVEGARDGGSNTGLPSLGQTPPSPSAQSPSGSIPGIVVAPSPVHTQDPKPTEPAPTLKADWESAPQTTEAQPEPFLEQDTETGVVLSGVRIRALIDAGKPLSVKKGNLSAYLSVEALAALGLHDEDVFSLSLTQPQENALRLTVEINGMQAEGLPDIQLSLQSLRFDPALSFSCVHASGKTFPCHEVNGYPAFTANLQGDYAIVSQLAEAEAPPASPAPPVVPSPAPVDLQIKAVSPSVSPLFLLLGFIGLLLFLLLLVLLWRRRRAR